MRTDHSFAWMQKKKFLYAWQLVAQQPEDTTSKYRTGKGTGAVVLATINSLPSFAGISIDAAGADGVGDEIQWFMPLPEEMDVKHPMRMRIHWTSSSATTADDVAFVAIYTAHDIHDTALTDPATALDTVIPSDLVTGAYDYQITDWGIVAGETFTPGQILSWEIRCSVADVDIGVSEYLYILGVEFMYSPIYTKGQGGSYEAVIPNF